MKNIQGVSIAVLSCALLICPVSQAQEATSTQVSVGLKLWNAAWSSYLPGTYAGVDATGRPVLGETFDEVEGKRKTNFLPSLVLRHGRYFVSASYGRFTSDFSVPGTPLPGPGGVTLITSRLDHFKRRESDLTAGYFVTQELALTLGYKDATEDRDIRLGIAPQAAPLLNNKAHGLLLGAVGSFAVQGDLRLYTTAGYGPARFKIRFADPTIANFDANGRYLIGEAGFSYPLFKGDRWLQNVTALLGYRTQTVKTDSRGTVGSNSRTVRDVRDGLVFSVTATL